VQAYQFLSSLGAAVVVAATKIDQVPRGRRSAVEQTARRVLSLPPEVPVLAVSARTGEGIKELWSALGPHLERVQQ
jgi:GTP-binding protein EngB required for normal cell division